MWKIELSALFAWCRRIISYAIARKIIVFPVVGIFAVLGLYLTWRSFAASPYTMSLEAESGSLTGNTSINSNIAASGSKAVAFAGGTSNPGGGTNPGAACPAGTMWCDEFATLALSDTTARRKWLPSEQGVNDKGHPGGGSFSWEWTPHGTPGLNLWTTSNGVLTMKAIRNPGNLPNVPNDRKWIGGTITSDPANGGSWTYGYFEFRARFPVHGPGMFPALWMYRNPEVSHHFDAEFDLIEIFGRDSQPWSTSIHWNDQRDSTDGDQGYDTDTKDWHRYSVDWQPNHIIFYRDGVEYARREGAIPQWFNGAEMGIRMDYAVDPNFNNNHSTAATPNPLYMEVDYVRAYKTKPNLATGPNDPHF